MHRFGRVPLLLAALCLAMTACGLATPSLSPPVAPDGLGPGSAVEATRDNVEVLRDLGGDHVLDHIFTGQKAFVVGFDVRAGQTWLRVQTPGTFGWVLHDPDDPALRMSEPACPEGDADRLLEVQELAVLTPWERLLCLDGLTVSLAPVTVAEFPSDLPYGGEPEWLANEPSLHLFGGGGMEGGDGPVSVHVDDAGTVRLEDGGWYAVTLQVNDPAAAACVRDLILDEMGIENPEQVALDLAPVAPGDSVLWCRQQFVVIAAEPVAAPPPPVEPRAAPSGGSWAAVPRAPIAGRESHGAVWTGREVLVWGGFATTGEDHQLVAAADGAAFDPETSTWRTVATSPLAGRVAPVMAWTGTEALVFGGMTGGFDLPFEDVDDGAAYDPAIDAWRPLSPMPDGFAGPAPATWTGEELVVVESDGRVAAYRAADDRWTVLPDAPLPDDLWTVGVVWTGREAVVIAYPHGVSSTVAAAAWDPAGRRWRELPESPVLALNGLPPVWTGSELMIVSRSLADAPPDGVPPNAAYASFYDPQSDAWRIGAAQDVELPTGPAAPIGALVVGLYAVYDLETDVWLEPPEHPFGEWGPPVATDTEVIFWGGSPGGDILTRFDTGLRYRPPDD